MSTEQKKKCILGNLVFLINFAQKVRTTKLNDYLKLVFLFLGKLSFIYVTKQIKQILLNSIYNQVLLMSTIQIKNKKKAKKSYLLNTQTFF